MDRVSNQQDPKYHLQKSRLFKRTTEQAALLRAWRKVYSNGSSSRSIETQNEVKNFADDINKKIKKIQRELRGDQFVFQPAIGKKVPKKDKFDFRPIVIAPIQTRIVQRAVLDQLLSIRKLHPFIHTPYSFGGVQKRDGDDNSAVPAAIYAVLEAKAVGLNYVRCADISSFFTKIKKSEARRIIESAVQDKDFIELFDRSIEVELSNLSALRNDAQRFPIGDIGVAQGSALSPLLGNILLCDFDKKMNEGDCVSIRYIDDIIILGPTEKAVNAKFKMARNLLQNLGMDFSEQKSSKNVSTFNTGFSFLGIEIQNGLIRPDGESRGRFKKKVTSILNSSQKKMLDSDKEFSSDEGLVPTLFKLSRTIIGWMKHYRFCNDRKTFRDLDVYVDREIKKYLGAYASISNKNPDNRRKFLGVGLMADVDLKPFSWPK